MRIVGFMCGPSCYEYNGRRFEFGMMIGPWPVRKDGEPYKQASNKFYDDIAGFLKMPEEERKTYKVGGGCEPLIEREK